MKLVENLSKKELEEVKREIGEAFVTNELFYEFGDLQERRMLVLTYMNIYVQCVYESKELYITDDGNGYIGVAYSDNQPTLPKVKMLFKLFIHVPYKKMKRMLRHVKAIAGSNSKYSKNTYTEVLMVCVKQSAQGKGYTRQLVSFAKELATLRGVPLLFDTDMKKYAEIYQHLGCSLYNQVTAPNGVTRYSLVWKPVNEDEV